MSKIKVNVILFGVGNVGHTLLNQVIESHEFIKEKRKIDLRFPIIVNSTRALFSRKPMPQDWFEKFQTISEPYKFQDIFDYIKKHDLKNLIAIDATASEEFVKNYPLLIQNGFDIVAANKKANTLSFSFYQEIRDNLNKYQKKFLYETNVGAGLPVIKTISDLHLSGDKITKIRGVFSGTLSYIFNRFSAEETSFSNILIEAEKQGYTEPDSREDLSGNDVARKLLILARELGLTIEFSDISVNSLLLPNLNEENTKAEYAINKALFDEPFKTAKLTQKENHVLRYIGEIDIAAKKFEVKLVSESQNSPIGQLKGTDNLIEIYSQTYGQIPIVIQGAGAGKAVTARGVLTDILQLSDQIKLKQNVLI